MAKPEELAEKIAHKVADALEPLERSMAGWPAEFREIVWIGVVEDANARRAGAAIAKRETSSV